MTNLELCGLLLSVVILAAAGCANTASAGERVWHSFCGTGTSCPAYSAKAQGLIFESGNLYGVAGGEGTGAAGVIFEWGPTSGSGQYTALYNFCPNNLNGQVCTDGDGPEGKLIMDSSGNLYGVTRDGGATTQNYPPGYGEIYWISPSASPPVVHHLWDFCSTNPPNCPEGNHPDAGLTYVGAATGTLYDGSSPLFGTTISGGANGAGTVFKLIPGGTPTAIANFCSASSCVAGQPCSAGVNCLPGQLPNAIIADSSGNLYGTTQEGPSGNTNAAILYELTPSESGYTSSILYTFCKQQNCTDGTKPMGPLTLHSGEILGTTMSGGRNLFGEVFQFPGSFFVLYSFCAQAGCADGSNPEGGVVIDTIGNLDGTASGGGTKGTLSGVAFQYGTQLTAFYSFGCSSQPCTDAQVPETGMVLDASGNLWGTSTKGGDNFEGALFEVCPGGSC